MSEGNNKDFLKKNGMIQLKKWKSYYTYPTYTQLRNLMMHTKYNGFDTCYHRLGKALIIDEEKFFEWAKNTPRFAELAKNRDKYRVIKDDEENKKQEGQKKILNLQLLRNNLLEATKSLNIVITILNTY